MTSEWQPIETAPKDGTKIISCHEGTDLLWVVHWYEFKKGIRNGQGEQILIPTDYLNQKKGRLYRPEKYCGSFQDGLFHGRGTISFQNDSNFINAIFKNGQLHSRIKNN